MLSERIESQQGYGLPATILMVIIFAIMGLVGLAMARQELRSQVQTTSRETAFYAAEMGLARGVDNWTRPNGVIPPGTSWLLDQGTLPGGSAYRVGATKLDDGSVHALYSIRAVGEAKDGTRQVTGLLIATAPVQNPFKAALEVKDSVYLAGTAEVNGFDHIPAAWNGPFCSSLDNPEAGVVMTDTMKYAQGGKKDRAFGVPPREQDPDSTKFWDFSDITYDELAAGADFVLPDGTVIDGTNPSPSLNADGTCNTTDVNNWGEPLSASHACSNWFPTIHVKGDLSLEANNYGQGLLLVDGDLHASGGFEFFGPVIVKGDLVADGGFRFYGGVKATNTLLGAGNAEIFYSACVLERALSYTNAARPRPLTERPWFSNR